MVKLLHKPPILATRSSDSPIKKTSSKGNVSRCGVDLSVVDACADTHRMEAADASKLFQRAELMHSGSLGANREEEAAVLLRRAQDVGVGTIVDVVQAFCLIWGIGVARDAHRGVRILRDHPDQGNPDLQYLLGGAYDNNWGLITNEFSDRNDERDRDEGKAMALYKASAEQGHPSAQYCFAVGLLQNAAGREEAFAAPSQAEAVRLLEAATRGGQPLAAFRLAKCHRDGEGVARNAAESERSLQTARELGFPVERYEL